MNKEKLSFVVKSALIYTLAYLFIGAIAYQLLTKPFYIGDDPVFTAYLRSQLNPAEWAHTNIWLVPGLLVRAVLLSLVILPFIATLKNLSFAKRTWTVFALTFVMIHLAAAAPSPGNIEGLIYMKPELVSSRIFILTQPEMILQCLLFALGLAYILNKPSNQLNREGE